MPNCFCALSGCLDRGGTDPKTNEPRGYPVDARTFKAHRLADQARLARQAQVASKQVVDDEVDDIAAFISSLTLADKVSSPSHDPGRMWSKVPYQATASDVEDDAGHSYHKPIPNSCKARVDKLLQHLSGIDSSARAFAAETAAALQHLGSSESLEQSHFPLKSLHQKGLSLQSDLETLTSKEAPVVEFKRSISLQVESSLKSIEAGKRQWKECKVQVQASLPGEGYNTGSCCSAFPEHRSDIMIRSSLPTTVTRCRPRPSAFDLHGGCV
jgi:hypothetical protein